MASKTVLAALAVAFLCALVDVEARHVRRILPAALESGGGGPLQAKPVRERRGIFGLHVHKRPKVLVVHQALPPQVVIVKKHRRPAITLKLGRHHRHRPHSIKVHLSG